MASLLIAPDAKSDAFFKPPIAVTICALWDNFSAGLEPVIAAVNAVIAAIRLFTIPPVGNPSGAAAGAAAGAGVAPVCGAALLPPRIAFASSVILSCASLISSAIKKFLEICAYK